MRSPEMGAALVDVIAARRAGSARIDHRVLFRLPVRSTGSVDRAIECLPGWQPAGDVPLVSFEDHTPGQGQYRSLEVYKAAMFADGAVSAGELDAEVVRRMAEAETTLPTREANLARVRELAAAGSAQVLAHDCVDAGEVAQVRQRGASVAEFPRTVAAARAAQEHQMPVVLGAPNVLLGGSHSGNASAEELIRAASAPVSPPTTRRQRCWRRRSTSPGATSSNSRTRSRSSRQGRPKRSAFPTTVG